MKEEHIRIKEIEFKINSQNDKRKELITHINPEVIEREQKMIKNFESERIKLKNNYEQNLGELKSIFENERKNLRSKFEKSQETVRKLTSKLSEYKQLKERERKELNKKLKEPCHRCQDYEVVLENLEAVNMEKEDAYNRIQNLEGELIQMKALKMLDYNKTPTKENTLHYTSNLHDINYDTNESFDFVMPQTPISTTSPIQNPQVYQRYREFQNKFISGTDKSPSVSRFTQKKSSIDTDNNDTSTCKKITENYIIQEEDEKSSIFDDRSKGVRQETKQVPLSTFSSACKNNTQSINIKNWANDEASAFNHLQHQIDNTRNNTSPYAKTNFDIDKLIEKYIGPKEDTKYDYPKKICTKEDLLDFNKKFVVEKSKASMNNRSIDPTMNLYSSVNKTSESIPSNATTAKHGNKQFNFSHQSYINPGRKNSRGLLSLKENFNSMIAKQPMLKNPKASKSKRVISKTRSKTKRKSASISMVPTSDKNPNMSMNVYQKQFHDQSQKENFTSIRKCLQI